MPEGDTIFRAARSLAQWLEGREITAARTNVASLPAAKLVGQRVAGVEAKGKHLLIRFDSGMTLHTHMRMTGSWHVYPAGERWRKPAHQARIVLEAGDRVAVCFNAPVVELLTKRGDELHPALTQLGPDVLADEVDLAEVRRRARARPPATTVGELLLDQQVVSGIGNIWRCEALFVERVDPWAPVGEVDDGTLDALVATASRLMKAGLQPNAARSPRHVYRRTNRPCPRCRTPVRSAKLGADGQPRDVYWCPNCQGRVRSTQ